MAYNSDGYIMIDFTEVDFRRTNQTIDGLYKRCIDVIGTNKFILVINANRKTPLPSVCSFINNQYVIESCIYTFAVSANDNLFIKRNEPDPSSLIDDTVITTTKTWSSDKINTELGGKQGTLTAGDNISIVNNVISAAGVKTFTYIGTNESINHRIDLPSDCHTILLIIPGELVPIQNYNFQILNSVVPVLPQGTIFVAQIYASNTTSGLTVNTPMHITFGNGYILTESKTGSSAYNLNRQDVVYTVYYL